MPIKIFGQKDPKKPADAKEETMDVDEVEALLARTAADDAGDADASEETRAANRRKAAEEVIKLAASKKQRRG